MSRYSVYGIFLLIGLGVSGCGLFRWEQREAWRTQAEDACISRNLVASSAYMSRTAPIDGPGTCGMSYPFKVSAFAGGAVSLNRQQVLACPIIPAIDLWLEEVVRPAARQILGSELAELRAGSYACRSRNNQRGARLSEHAFGNALDVMAFRLQDGREITISGGWHGQPQQQEFLREVFVGACRHFTTVLGPGSDAFHYDHFHLDLARHDPRGVRRVCRPVIKYTPRSTVSQPEPIAGTESITKPALQSLFSSPQYSSPQAKPLHEEDMLVEEEIRSMTDLLPPARPAASPGFAKPVFGANPVY
jgi:hypothetical protein